MKLSSSAFPHDGPIPIECTGDGQDSSPDLTWDQVPLNTREFALICDDPDAPGEEPWVHWVLFKIPAEWRTLPKGIGRPSAAMENAAQGLFHGRNSWPDGDTACYRGPLPPRGHGVHHYRFKLYALDQLLQLPAGATKTELLKSIHGHVLDEVELVGTYQR